jgi:hypothetical protein
MALPDVQAAIFSAETLLWLTTVPPARDHPEKDGRLISRLAFLGRRLILSPMVWVNPQPVPPWEWRKMK